ncbi:hypothetical protein AKJ16_DCAP00739 [Drosera capensis]
MEKNLLNIKILPDSLAAINSLIFNADLIEHTLRGLGIEFESLIVVVMNAPVALSFDDIRFKIFLHEHTSLLWLSLAHPGVNSRVVVGVIVLLSHREDVTRFRVRLRAFPTRPRNSPKGSSGIVRHRFWTVQRLCEDNDCTVIFIKDVVFVKDISMGRTLVQGPSKGRLYPISIATAPSHFRFSVLSNLGF